jgi:hypothetical protein
VESRESRKSLEGYRSKALAPRMMIISLGLTLVISMPEHPFGEKMLGGGGGAGLKNYSQI